MTLKWHTRTTGDWQLHVHSHYETTRIIGVTLAPLLLPSSALSQIISRFIATLKMASSGNNLCTHYSPNYPRGGNSPTLRLFKFAPGSWLFQLKLVWNICSKSFVKDFNHPYRRLHIFLETVIRNIGANCFSLDWRSGLKGWWNGSYVPNLDNWFTEIPFSSKQIVTV